MALTPQELQLFDDEEDLRNWINALGLKALRVVTAILHKRLLNENATPDQAQRLANQSWIGVGCQYEEFGFQWDAVALKVGSPPPTPPPPVVNPL